MFSCKIQVCNRSSSSHCWLTRKCTLEHVSPFAPPPLQRLQHYYETFRLRSSLWYANTCGASAYASSLTSKRQIPKFHAKAHITTCHLYADCRLASKKVSAKLSPNNNLEPLVLTILNSLSAPNQWFTCVHFYDKYLTNSIFRIFPARSPPRLFTSAAVGGLKPPPSQRFRDIYSHLLHSTEC